MTMMQAENNMPNFQDALTGFAPDAADPDPYIQYYVVDVTLRLSPGKIGAQTAHAATLAVLDLERRRTVEPDSLEAQDFHAWLGTDMAKIILAGKEADLERLEQAGGYGVRDHGHTEVAPGTLTVVALRPMRKSQARPLVKRLQLYRAP